MKNLSLIASTILGAQVAATVFALPGAALASGAATISTSQAKPVTGPYELWSDKATWGGSVPTAATAVVIPAGKRILLDQSTVKVKSIVVQGELAFADRDINLTTDWIMVEKSGYLKIGTPDKRFSKKAVITLTDPRRGAGVTHDGGFKFLAVRNGGKLDIHSTSGQKVSWTQLSETVQPGATSISLATPVNWQVGDEIVIAPSGFDPYEAEKVTITAVNGNRVTFQPALKYTHIAVLETRDGKPLDMRAEVGLLTRNVVVQGDAASDKDNYGGHIALLPGTASAKIDGLELRRMGQQSIQGRYPVHLHHMMDASSSFIKNSSINGSFQRCIVVHGTYNALVENNVSYNNLNHCYVFAEDGNEFNNKFKNNLAVLVRSINDTEDRNLAKQGKPRKMAFPEEAKGPSCLTPLMGAHRVSCQEEDRSSGFWGENPLNTLIGNHVAGVSGGNGFFYSNSYNYRFYYLQNEKKYISDKEFRSKFKMDLRDYVQKGNPLSLPDAQPVFEDNTAHSVSHIYDEGFNAFQNTLYSPQAENHGLFARDAFIPITFKKLTLYSSVGGAWIESEQTISDSVIAGDLKGTIINISSRSNKNGLHQQIPVKLENTSFVVDKSNPLWNPDAFNQKIININKKSIQILGYKREEKWGTRPNDWDNKPFKSIRSRNGVGPKHNIVFENVSCTGADICYELLIKETNQGKAPDTAEQAGSLKLNNFNGGSKIKFVIRPVDVSISPNRFLKLNDTDGSLTGSPINSTIQINSRVEYK